MLLGKEKIWQHWANVLLWSQPLELHGGWLLGMGPASVVHPDPTSPCSGTTEGNH